MPTGMYRPGLEDVTRYAFLIAYALSASSLCAAQQTNTFFWGFTLVRSHLSSPTVMNFTHR
ncbi:hypothetical protein JAAARDRAFT_41566 [Jaapia argillacea MUCL 33604]|uniref:Uncharacterized protein n=1 Tax=Jaapia argillacea MUCL 33604 TaxID=933084 RepID=A0A067PAW1_9AGAM|nr:hypothetical protein JAAARDRAFT_41566 [Jaapia argillacea MUCL 33604]